METNIKQRIAAGALALSLLGGTGVGVAAQQGQAGGAAGLVAAVVGVQANDVVEVNVVDSLNNLRALNNVLNNSPILSQNDIDISDIDVITGNDIAVVVANNNIDLNALGITLEDIVAILVVNAEDFVIVV